MTMSRIWPFVDSGRPWGRRTALPVCRQRQSSLRSATFALDEQRLVDRFV